MATDFATSTLHQAAVSAEAGDAPIGGSYLCDGLDASALSIPELLSAELRSMGDAAARFVQERVLPEAEALEQHDLPRLRSLMAEAGAQGFFGCEIPEEYGGLGLPKMAAVVVGNPFSALAGFAVTVLGHASIGTLPLLYFGTEAAKQQYLPRLASGAAIGAYCLSEPGSGSDAQAARATATLQPDGSYLLNGTKAWITNAGIADLFTVFVKVRRPDGDKLSAFLVERGFAGVSTGAEERKLGIRSSSTCPLMLDNVAVPSQNLIGAEGEGAKIAFNILNVGRYKMGGATAHAARASLLAAVKYAKERQSFGKPLAAYGAVSEKIGRMAAHVFAAESAAYAVLSLIDNRAAASGTLRGQLKAIEEFSVEASIVKVLGSETLDMAVDETLQIHGGYGYTADLPLERHYRDSRINRIFEGTNEINRLLICSTLLKRALGGKLPLLARAESWRASGWRAVEQEPPLQQRLACCARVLQGLAIEMLASAAGHFGMAIEQEQEVLTRCADAQIAAFAAQAANARCVRLAQAGHAHASGAAVLAQAYAVEALGRICQQVREVAALVPGLDRKPSLPEWATEESSACIARMRDAAQIVLSDPGYPIA